MEQLKFYELLIMSVKGYPNVYDKSKASSKDEINNNNNNLFKEQNMVTIITNTEIQVAYVSFAIWD